MLEINDIVGPIVLCCSVLYCVTREPGLVGNTECECHVTSAYIANIDRFEASTFRHYPGQTPF